MTVIVCRYPRIRSSTSRDIIYSFINKVLADETIVLMNHGKKTFDFVDVADVCQAAELLLNREVPSGVLHISSGECVNLLDLVQLVEDVTGKRATIRFEHNEAASFDADHYLLDIMAACDGLGYQPQVSIREMVERSFQWVMRHEGFKRHGVIAYPCSTD
jgi:nucleoside-diphosphate-sugar epimerase